jgi:Mesyanzhinovviridae DNA primase
MNNKKKNNRLPENNKDQENFSTSNSKEPSLDSMLEPKTEESIKFLKMYCSEGLVLLAAICPVKENLIAKTFSPEQFDTDAKDFVKKYNGKRNIYFSVNPTNKILNKKTKKEDVSAFEYLHVDIDPDKGKDLNSERERILNKLRTYDPQPTIVLDSGNGYQAFWKLEERVNIKNFNHIKELESYNIFLEKDLRGDNCHNIDRIMRLPGTINLPNKIKRKLGRKPALAKLVWFKNISYPISNFRTAKVSKTPPAKEGISLDDIVEVNLDTIQLAENWRYLITMGRDQANPNKYASRSEAVFAVARHLVLKNIPDEIIAGILINPKYKISEHILENKEPKKYLNRQIQRAKDYVIAPELEELNEKHAVIKTGNKVGVLTLPTPGEINRKLEILSIEGFKNWYWNRVIEVGTDSKGRDITKKLGIWWLEHPKRREYQGIVFAPNKEIPGYYNLWDGFAVEPISGDCSIFLEHIRVNVAHGNEEHFNYVIAWMADIFQNPDSKCGTSLVLRGKQGTGKTIIGKVLSSLLEKHCLRISDPRHLAGHFNSHLSSILLLHADEAFWAGDKSSEGKIKDLITGDTQLIEYKGKEPFSIDNFVRLLVTGNPDWVVPAGHEERRFAVFDMSERNIQDHEFFESMQKQMDHGGREALLHYLLNFDLSKVNLKKIPKTQALLHQKLHTLDSMDSWLLDILREGILPGYNEHNNKTPTFVMFRSYLKHSHDLGIPRRSCETRVGMYLKKLFPKLIKVNGDYEESLYASSTTKVKLYSFPPLNECRRAFEGWLGIKFDWDDEDEDWKPHNEDSF